MKTFYNLHMIYLKKTLLFTVLVLSSNNLFSQISAEEVNLLSRLPSDLSSALTETKKNPSAKSEDMLANATRLDMLNQRKSSDFYQNYSQIIDLGQHNVNLKKRINFFGYDFFSGIPYSFFSSEDIAVTDDYQIQIGDTFEFQVTGSNEVNGSFSELKVTPAGEINIPLIGIFKAKGLTLRQLKASLVTEFQNKYPGSSPYISIITTALISTFVSGEVLQPGAYTVRNLTRASALLNLAGGLTPSGSLREINIISESGEIRTLDLYSLLLDRNSFQADFLLRNGDRIHIPVAKKKIAIMGAVKRERVFEILPSDSLESILNFAGGFTANSLKSGTVFGAKKVEPLSFEEGRNDTANNIQDGAVIYINSFASRAGGSFEISSSVFSNIFAIEGATNKLSTFISLDNLPLEIYKGIAVISRLDKKYNLNSYSAFSLLNKSAFEEINVQPADRVLLFTKEDIEFLNSNPVRLALLGDLGLALQSILNQRTRNQSYQENLSDELVTAQPDPENIESRDQSPMSAPQYKSARAKPDDLYVRCRSLEDIYQVSELRTSTWMSSNLKETMINSSFKTCPSIFDLNLGLAPYLMSQTVFITGEVYNQGGYPIASGQKTLDVIQLASPVNQSSKQKIELINATGEILTNILESYQVKPFDSINIFTSAMEQQDGYVNLIGEFRSPGKYKLKRGESLLSMINRAGGYTNLAFPEGGILTRESVKIREKLGLERAKNELRDSISTAITSGVVKNATPESIEQLIEFANNLDSVEALGRLVSEFRLKELKNDPQKNNLLVSGDTIYIPKKNRTVTISGHVLNPVTVNYMPGFSVEDYIRLAGGFRTGADKSSTYFISPTGIAQKKISLLSFQSRAPIIPGSNIIVPRQSRVLDGLGMIETLAPTIASLSISLASIASINSN
jgi:polysaccharide biosynthesis/export protein